MIDSLIEEPVAAPKKPEPVVLRTAHDYSLVTVALDSRQEELKKLAKKNLDEGYTREARAISADAEAIEHHVLPQFRAQRELPLVTSEQLEKEISGALRVLVMRAFDGLSDKKVLITPEGLADRKNRLLTQLTTRISLYATQLADEAFNQGVAARSVAIAPMASASADWLRATGD
jgi:hypothetical protein